MVDVGGTHVKVLATGRRKHRQTDSGPGMTAQQMVAAARGLASDWRYEVVSIGYPGPVLHGRPVADPKNLGPGWVGFDYVEAFGKPVRMVNDAAMQALGSYRGGRMLFLGLGTGLGSAMIVNGMLEPMELAHLPYKHGKTFEHFVGARGLERLGAKEWRKTVADVVARLSDALEPHYVVIGGGNARLLRSLPKNVVLGKNDNAFRGGFLLWEHPRGKHAQADKES